MKSGLDSNCNLRPAHVEGRIAPGLRPFPLFSREIKMAVRGRKPTATVNKLATGNPGRRPLPKHEPESAGRPVKPPKIGKRAGELWDEVADFPWLSQADGYKLHIWCELQAQFERSSRAMVAARIAQLRAVSSELGLDPPSRARLGADAKTKEADPADKYFE